MPKQLSQNFEYPVMFSKPGKYISKKLLNFNKPSLFNKNQRQTLPSFSSPHQTKKPKILSCTKQKQNPSHVNKTQPQAGFYNVNYSQIQKNPKLYNFNRSVPHFNRQKYQSNQTQFVVNDLPDSSLCGLRLKGAVQLNRMAGRQNIKGSERKTIYGCNQNRFILKKDKKAVQFGHTRVQMDKDLPRTNLNKTTDLTPQYSYNINILYKRPDSHLIPFQKSIPRTTPSNFLFESSQFITEICQTPNKCKDWKTMISRQTTGIVPGYMDKSINNRSCLNFANLKTLEMNCSNMKQNKKKLKRQKRAKNDWVQSDFEDKENFCYQSQLLE